MEDIARSAQTESVGLDRRGLLKMASAGLLLGAIPRTAAAAGESPAAAPVPDRLVQRFLRIDPDGTVTVFAKHIDMGQGTWSGLASIVAEELDADWSKVRVEGAPVRLPDYGHLVYKSQTTGGSTSMSNSWKQLREAGATARAMLVEAAARRWKVPVATISVKDGIVRSGSHQAGRSPPTPGACPCPPR